MIFIYIDLVAAKYLHQGSKPIVVTNLMMNDKNNFILPVGDQYSSDSSFSSYI